MEDEKKFNNTDKYFGKKLRKIVIFSLFFLSVFFFLTQIFFYWRDLSKMDKEIKKEMEKQRLLQVKIDSIENIIKKLDTDTFLIEKIAREKLGMIKKGEQVYKIKIKDIKK